MVIGKPAPFVRAFVDAVDAAIRTHQPHHAMSVTQRTWLAFCITAVLVTNSICWTRFERASPGTYALAALSWMFRHSKIPWDQLLVASVRVILRHHGITSGSLVVDDTDNPRSKSAKALAYLYKLRDKESGGYLWGQSLVFLVLVTPKISLPAGVVFYQPAPELSTWYKTDKVLKKQGVPAKQRPRKPAPNPQYPTKEQLALRLLASFKAQQPDVRIHAVMADALYGTATFVDGASALFRGVQVISPIRSNQNIRVGQRHQHVADYFATHPGTPYSIRIRGGVEVVAMVGSARLYVCAHKTKRFIVAIKYAAEETYRYLVASDLSWPTLDIVQGHTLRWLVEVWHRILQSGCRLEARQLATDERLERCVTLYSVIAWRVFYALMLARAVPEIPCDVLLDIEEWQALYCAIHHCPTPPDEPPSLDQAVRWIAQLGGFVDRRRRDQPGAETLWRGFQPLMDLTSMYRIMRPNPP
jgi:Transposase Tn5 dimerisation domain/DDE superfamily endonuclease